MIYKYLVEKRLHIDLIPSSKSSERNYSISYDKTMPLFDSYENAYERILREKKELVLKLKDSIVGNKAEALVLKMTGDFEIEFQTDEKDIGKQTYKISAIDDGIYTKIKGKTMEIEEEFSVVKILKKNLIYTITEGFTDNKYNYKKFYSHFYKNLEDASVKTENIKYLEPEKFAQLTILDKSKIHSNELMIDTVVKDFLLGNIKDSSVFDVFNKDIVSRKFFENKEFIANTLRESREKREEDMKEKETLNKKIDEIRKQFNEILEERDSLKEKLKNA